jgi:hypothetical protein
VIPDRFNAEAADPAGVSVEEDLTGQLPASTLEVLGLR